MTRTATEALGDYLARQRWYPASDPPATVRVVHRWVERTEWPQIIRLVVEAESGLYQVVVAQRPVGQHDFLRGHEDSIVGEVGEDPNRSLAYDAVQDPEAALALLSEVAPELTAERSRVMGVEQSNTSLVYDDRIVLKLFRRLQPGPNPEVEITSALSEAGFPWVAAPEATLSREGFDLAVAQPYLAGGAEGWALALTSLRDLFGVHDTRPVPVVSFDSPPPPPDPGQAGGDFSAEARRLGETTAAMHAALAEAFGRQPGQAGGWADAIAGEVAQFDFPDDLDRAGVARTVDALRRSDPGPAIRIHGDFHLGQVMRTDSGWYVLDFEGEPARPIDDRRRHFSPMRDVAGMLRSFHYASAVVTLERDAQDQEVGAAWEERNRAAFLSGYLPGATESGVVPADEAAQKALLSAFELEKALYELSYERSYRPHWESIPLAALRRMVQE